MPPTSDARASGGVVAEVEVYTPLGVIAGDAAGVTTAGLDGQELIEPIEIANARWYPLDGSAAEHRGTVHIAPDDALLVVVPEDGLKVHMAWYSIAIELGPYRLCGSIATHPGFDPNKAIARPSGTFVSISDAVIDLLGVPSGSSARRAHVLVNRYAVDRVTSILMLGYFFPGAQLVAAEVSVPVA